MKYSVNATVTSDAWTYVDADDLDTAIDRAHTLRPGEFELGDPFECVIVSVDESDV